MKTGDLRAFQAAAGGRRVLRGFASATEEALLGPGIAAWAAQHGPARDEPGLARLLQAAGLGTPTALPMKAVLERLRFLFDFGTFGRLCPVARDAGRTRLRWQMTLVDDGPPTRGPGVQAEQDVWITLEHDAGAGTVTLTAGREGC
ncbi:MAG: hypothetical protein R3F43_22995 [bacterium]